MDSYNNIVLYVLDSLRIDCLPNEWKNRSVYYPCISQSTWSAPSFSTLSTGLYPEEHGVMNWEHQIPEETQTIFEATRESSFYQETPGPGIKSVLKDPDWMPVEDLEPPFLYMERDCQSHTPFGEYDSVFEYYSATGKDYEQVRADYEEGVSQAFEQLKSRLRALEERGLRESTCVIVTSDHGELLGEYGTVGHTTPLCPELVRVPVLFLDLPEEDFQTEPGTIIEHVDLVTTLASEFDLPVAQQGVNILSETRDRRWGYSSVWQTDSKDRRFYEAAGAFTSESGRVLTDSSRFMQSLYAIYLMTKKAKRPAISKPALFKTLWERNPSFGTTPPIDVETLREFQNGLDEGTALDQTLDDGTEDRLKQLGYLDQ
ncbi:sulfatase-like hydrolase/transferase [Halorubrum ezzemoulense]|uniref:Sulfatase N-terminal domain-containing protein n=1 Tax=Halorubrum ezzemoulense TaxID=337243 RepID=A0A256JH11_HALEZ|nr:sulfatase-like hydrolase/transferase [Halorubrum ezzemoulense]OYR68158.1 hypothetical protein DJ78_14590 [Halorubrum ezzemoulense]